MHFSGRSLYNAESPVVTAKRKKGVAKTTGVTTSQSNPLSVRYRSKRVSLSHNKAISRTLRKLALLYFPEARLYFTHDFV